MNYEEVKEKFLEYVDSFDLSDQKITSKREHSICVGFLAKILANRLNLNEEETELISVIGILHDIGRFKQLEKYHTFSDLNSIDHGDLGVKLLFEDGMIRKFIDTNKYDEIIYDAIKYHNKYKIANRIKDTSLKFCKMIRDIDKIDIFRVLTNNHSCSLLGEIPEDALKSFYGKQGICWTKNDSKTKELMGNISFIFDLNFNESIDILNDNRYFKDFIDSIEVDEENVREFDNIKKFISDNTNLNI